MANEVMQFAITAEQYDVCRWRVVVEGELDLATAPRFESVLGNAASADGATVEVDLSGVSFVDSSGLRAIVATARDLEQRGGRLRISAMSAAARRVLEVAGLLDRFRAPQSTD